ncbi:DNA repair protein complementing XP-A cells-like isoform X2 [Limulus polyphemus]|uniref:DNA repair protein complementing XP-A cells-like isoform X2 n=1 Tax=Limulus polyphemus TaxID=6850 RepID=A0ABM1TRQ3_LIMPO|nr:DNA repair protein complementing XP-A cells-like isoform X2 [Limulus polyphemus]
MKMQSSDAKLTPSQQARVERNRQRALLLRQARLAKQCPQVREAVENKTTNLRGRPKDSGGGFLLEETEEDLPTRRVVILPAPPVVRPQCEECGDDFVHSYLSLHFDVLVCDSCRDADGKHALIAKTDAKNRFLLKDCDLDKREPPLKFIVKKNPHHSTGDMKLYLLSQVEKRALEVWNSEEELEEAKRKRLEEREKRKHKAYNKKVKALRMTVRSSLYNKISEGHVHSYGQESPLEDDMYEKVCLECGHKVQFEKM